MVERYCINNDGRPQFERLVENKYGPLVKFSDYDALAARLAEAKLSRDSWKREAEMNADFGDQLHTALAALKKHGIHVAEKWCWCSPDVTDYRHNREGRAAGSAEAVTWKPIIILCRTCGADVNREPHKPGCSADITASQPSDGNE